MTPHSYRCVITRRRYKSDGPGNGYVDELGLDHKVESDMHVWALADQRLQGGLH